MAETSITCVASDAEATSASLGRMEAGKRGKFRRSRIVAASRDSSLARLDGRDSLRIFNVQEC